MKKIFENLLEARVEWQKAPDNSNFLEARFQNQTVKLRLNDFPEEVLCTMFADGEEQDFDDFPKNWTLPGHRKVAKGA